jgi:Glycosyl transferase family 2
MSKTDPNGCHSAECRCLTVLMPVFNGDRYLRSQLDSILNQDYSCIRVVVLDDGSEDHSSQIAMAAARADKRVTVLRSYQNLGLIPSIGKLLESVTTPFFALSDQDDVWDRSKLSKSVSELISNEAELIYSDVRICNAAGSILKKSYLRSRRIRPVTGRDPVPFVFRNPAIGHTIVSTQRVAREAADIPTSLRFHESWLIAVACKFGHVEFINEPLGSYRVHSRNVVGPQQGILQRLAHALRSPLHLRDRELTRATGLAALARLRPELGDIAASFDARGIRRLAQLPTFGRFVLQYADRIGTAPALAEVLWFALDGLLPASGKPNANTSRAA